MVNAADGSPDSNPTFSPLPSAQSQQSEDLGLKRSTRTPTYTVTALTRSAIWQIAQKRNEHLEYHFGQVVISCHTLSLRRLFSAFVL